MQKDQYAKAKSSKLKARLEGLIAKTAESLKAATAARNKSKLAYNAAAKAKVARDKQAAELATLMKSEKEYLDTRDKMKRFDEDLKKRQAGYDYWKGKLASAKDEKQKAKFSATL